MPWSENSSGHHVKNKPGKGFNSPNFRFTGSSVPPLRSMDSQTEGYGGARKKIVSGRFLNSNSEVQAQEAWPHCMLDRGYIKETPDYPDLTVPQFFAGYTAKILCEMHPSLAGSRTENQLRHLNRLALYATQCSREEMLEFDGSFLESIEQGYINWLDWQGLQAFHNKHLDSMRLRSSNWGIFPTEKVDKTAKAGTFVSEPYMRSNKICFRFQHNACDEEGSHTLADTNMTVQHICGLCHKMKRENNAEHGYKSCPLKKQKLFQ